MKVFNQEITAGSKRHNKSAKPSILKKGYKTIIKYIYLAFLSLVLAACGSYSFTGTSISPKVETFSVENFPNRADVVNPSLSQDLSDGLRDKLLRETRLRMTDRDGDIEFSGMITDYRVAPSAVQSGDMASLNRLTISVRVSFENHVEPDESFNQNFSAYEEFDAATPLSQVEDNLVQRILEDIIQDIFNKAVINW